MPKDQEGIASYSLCELQSLLKKVTIEVRHTNKLLGGNISSSRIAAPPFSAILDEILPPSSNASPVMPSLSYCTFQLLHIGDKLPII
ncbi:hypothetical protein CEXT_612061 [Caerostris extrusa]|uniref:Uncharacterized protein n=1 Tax=Caerostris extrusa TaxID=172846 RepID=A0AAV4PSS2_CAEEX|nr:hypothetical protein CEXT_612061 [Caerostris extrusa]